MGESGRDLRPWCGVCGRRVDELRVWTDKRSLEFVYEARCHGAVEETRFRASWVDVRPRRLVPGLAFRQQAIGHQAGGLPSPDG